MAASAAVIVIIDPVFIADQVACPVVVPAFFVIGRRRAVITGVPEDAAGEAQGGKRQQHE